MGVHCAMKWLIRPAAESHHLPRNPSVTLRVPPPLKQSVKGGKGSPEVNVGDYIIEGSKKSPTEKLGFSNHGIFRIRSRRKIRELVKLQRSEQDKEREENLREFTLA